MPEKSSPPAPLRLDLDIAATEHEGASVFVLRDPTGLSDKALAVSPGALAVAALFDGRRGAEELKDAVAKDGASIAASDIEGLARELERAGMLETPEIAKKRHDIILAFKASPKRPMALPGAYPEAPLELAAHLGGFFRDPKGPGRPLADKPAADGAAPLGLIAPHIDLGRGGPAYAWAYGALADAPPPDVVVAFGVAHASPDSPWVLTPKEYETPHGPISVDKELYKDLCSSLWYEPTADEWVHRLEHSLEFQALWLKFLWREKTPAWVPVLCSSFDRFCPDRPPSSVKTIDEALDKMAAALAARQAKGQRVLVLAGVDFAHVGPRFGDELQLGPELEKRVEGEDRKSLERALSCDPDEFYMSVVADGHWRKVCGLSATYSALRCLKKLGAKPGRLLTYGQAPDPAGGLVSFASAVFPRG